MIELIGISKTYQTDKIAFNALKKIDLKIEQGEFVAIMGASGSGKSTLLHILGFLDPPDSGAYRFLGNDVSKLNDKELATIRNQIAGFVFQQFHLLSGRPAQENVALPKIYAFTKNKHEKTELEKLADMGLAARAHHIPNALSGGERQRVAIARALINNPLILFADEPTGNLDSKNAVEVMKIFKNLHDSGMTIVLVTHEKSIAEEADRIITMKDGVIISDEKHTPHHKTAAKKPTKNIQSIIHTPRHITPLEIKENIFQAWRAMGVNKFRTLLSMLGILIGIAAVITMLALGQGATESIKQDLSKLGSNLLIIRQAAQHNSGVSLGASSYSRLTLTDIPPLNELSTTQYSSGVVSGRAQIVYRANNWNTLINGVGPNYKLIRDYTPESGRFFTNLEYDKREKVALIGQTIYKELFKTENPIGAIIKINKITFKIIGVLPEKGFSRGRDNDDMVLIPLTTAMYRLLGKKYLDSIEVQVKSDQTIESAKSKIMDIMQKRFPPVDGVDAIEIRDMSEIQAAIKGTVNTIAILLGVVAAISLLVGGIGIMNMMLVSVTERTKEIGIRKAIGATQSDIMLQFLIESIVLTVTGGFLGIAVSFLAILMVSFFTGWTMVITLKSILLSTGFSLLIGIFFGLWPAKKAAELNTIDALRYE